MSDALPRREVRPEEMQVFYRLLARFPNLAQVEEQLEAAGRQEQVIHELRERVKALTQPRLTVASYEAGRSGDIRADDWKQPWGQTGPLRPKTIREARELLADKVITVSELRRLIGYGPTDEELDAASAEERAQRPPRHVIARMMWGAAWRLAPVLLGPGLWPYPAPFVKALFWGLVAAILVITGLAGGLWRRLGLAGSLWRVALASLIAGVGWLLGLHEVVAGIILGAVICIGDVTARVVLEDE